MLYTEFQGEKLSMLGFGAMRLPTLENGSIDEKQVDEMVKCALEGGVNYFDTAYPYHGGMSEIVLGRALRAYPRASYALASKYPGHQISESYDPAAIFEEQLKKCGVEYFDFYLLHNVYENSIQTYLDPRWGILDYFREQKRLGRIRHLGFSSHGSPACLREFLDAAGADMEFCQIQLNWLDWTLQNAREKVALLNGRGIPVWVMEPVRGGRLCALDAKDEAALKALRPDEGIPAWGFRFLQDVPGVAVILSGMSNLAQMKDNLATFAERRPLSAAEKDALLTIAEGMKNAVPCTGCRYCTDHCPMGLDIPLLMAACTELRFTPTIGVAMRLEGLPAEKQPSACLACGACARMCPQKIDIPAVMRELTETLQTIPKWTDICRQREAAAKACKQSNR
ncbi:MAG: aldo/keto reductase [Clostridia bacterium]|nr:aldo/keto reductase [Clostridia bacterium]